MAVLRTARADLVDSSGSATNTISFDCSGGRTLLVASENSVNTAGDTTGATYNGVAMTEIARIARPSQNREIVLFGLHNPASGANNIVVTRSTASGRFVASAIAYSGTDTDIAIPVADDDYAKETNGTSTSGSLTFANGGGEAIYMIGVFGSGGQAASSGATLLSSFDIISDFENSTFPATANYTITANFTSAGYALAGVAIQESGGITVAIHSNLSLLGVG